MARLNDVPHLAELWAFDRTANENLARGGFSVLETAEMATDIAGRSGSLLGAARNLYRAAGMKRVLLGDVAWSLHAVIEPPLASLQDAVFKEVVDICLANGGAAIPDTIPRVTRARPFRTIKAIVGPQGERWLPCHGVFPAALANPAVQAVKELLGSRGAGLAEHAIRVPVLLSAVGHEILVEPQLMWPDSLSGFQKAHAPAQQVSPNLGNEDHIEARSFAHALRRDLIDLLAAHGGAHMQIGRSYRYADDLSPGMRQMLVSLKTGLDPDNILNPGVLGLVPRGG
jgi:FAD/FMN-containing dehydrogenase